MFDILIIAVLAVVGIAALFLAFGRVREVDVDESVLRTTTAKPKKKKQPKREEKLDAETEELIARELARKPTDMSTDSKRVEPTTLETVRKRHHTESQQGQAQTAPRELTAQEKQVERELGFKLVADQKRERKQKGAAAKKAAAPEAQAEQSASNEEEELVRKINNFFRNNNNSNAGKNRGGGQEQVKSGPKVSVHGEIANARTWGDV